MIRRPPRSTPLYSSAASDVYKRQNLFGLIPGYSKPGYHAKLADKERFADMLLDINTRLPARLSVMDAVTALEGEGPGSGGDARFFGSLLASDDPVALDAIACVVA